MRFPARKHPAFGAAGGPATAALGLTLGLCAAAPAVNATPGWGRGFERLSYHVTWGYVSAGEAILQARSPGPGRAEFLSETCANGAVDGLYEDRDRLLAHSRFDGWSWRTRAFRTARDKDAEWDGRQYRFTANGLVYIRDLANGNTDYLPVPKGTLDVLTALYAIRGRPLEPGASFTLPVLDRGETFRLHATVEAREHLDTVLGADTATIRVATFLREPGSGQRQRPLTVWFTADRRHLPVRLAAEAPIGSISLRLRGIRTEAPPDPRAGLSCR